MGLAPALFAQVPTQLLPLLRGSASGLRLASPQVTKRIFAASRAQIQAPASFLPRVQRSIVQIARPSAASQADSAGSASGFLLKAYGKTWVVSAYHVMGRAGSQRVARMPQADGSVKDVIVTVAASGMTGWNSLDIALAEINPNDIPAGMEPLTLGKANLRAPVFSAGYITGSVNLQDFLVVRRNFLNATGFNLLSSYHINGSTPEHFVTGKGQCGSPLVQQIPGTEEWQAVGVHNGHCVNTEESSLSRGSAVNLELAVPYLLEPYLDNSVQIPSRGLAFRGHEIGRLEPFEQVSFVVWRRDGEVIFKRDMKPFTGPYSDDHAEMALEDFNLLRGDEIEFHIAGKHPQRGQHISRSVTYKLP